jgi:hypothetical protein
MRLETPRLVIRSVEPADPTAYPKGGEKECQS